MKRGNIRINVNDIIGKRLGKLEVISYASCHYTMTISGERLRHFYICKCECGNITTIQRDPLLFNIIHSCGCGRRGRHGHQNEKQYR